MASLTGTKIKDTYDSLIKVSDNGALDGTLQTLTDGLGNNSALSLSTAGASVTGTLAVSGAATLSSTLAVTGNLSVDTNVLFVNTSNNFVGINESTPLVPLHISRDAASGENLALILDNNNTTANAEVGLLFRAATGGQNTDFQISTINTAANQAQLVFRSDGGTERARFYNGGDISFRDSSSNEAFYWDASAASLGIGTTNPKARTESYYLGGATSNLGDNVVLAAGTDGGGVGTYTQIGLGYHNRNAGNYYPAIIASVIENSAGQNAEGIAFATRSVTTGTTRPTERMRITSGGDVFFGTQGIPNGTSIYGSAFRVNTNSRMTLNMATSNSGAQGHIEFYNPNGLVGSISTSGSATAYNTSSDYRLKEDWIPMEGALDRVDALKPINFAWKADGSRVDGFLAHELAEVVPEAVTGEKDATEIRSVEVSPAVYEDVIHPAEEAVYETIEHPAIAEELDEEGNVLVEAQDAWTEEVLVSEAKEEWVEKVLVSEAVFEDQEFPVYQGIDQSKVVPLLVAAIQELRAEIEALKALS
jgi:hypothetical protein